MRPRPLDQEPEHNQRIGHDVVRRFRRVDRSEEGWGRLLTEGDESAGYTKPGAEGANERRNRPGIPQLSHDTRYPEDELAILERLQRLPTQTCMVPLRTNLACSLKRPDQRSTQLRTCVLWPKAPRLLESLGTLVN